MSKDEWVETAEDKAPLVKGFETLSLDELETVAWCVLTISKGFDAGIDGKTKAKMIYRKLMGEKSSV
jgi:hypothetical protein